MIASTQQPQATHTRVRRAGSVLAFIAGLLLVWTPADAEQPPELLHVRDSQQRLVPGEGLDSIPGSSKTSRKKTIHLQDALTPTSPPVPSADHTSLPARASVVMLTNRDVSQPRLDLGWGLAGTSASFTLTGALLLNVHSEQLRKAAKDLPSKEARNQHPLEHDLERTQKIIVGLYALSGSRIVSGVVLMAHERPHLKSVRARLAADWMEGRPAARLEISF